MIHEKTIATFSPYLTMTSPHTFTQADMAHLRRTIALATEALEAGDAPFGSVLVDGGGAVLREDRNRVHTRGDITQHPEFQLALWAAANMDPGARAAATVYTSGEHCTMCAAAHARVGLGRVVYVASGEQLDGWLDEFRREGRSRPRPKVATLAIRMVAPEVEVLGPVMELEESIRELHWRYAGGLA
ncbi:cytidine/deoxycytidylate deaminase [Nemania abortiva]|nr:cytidine/deoxycytidylate deaminase [Nemania abortiva]